jgi:hypothetical protein
MHGIWQYGCKKKHYDLKNHTPNSKFVKNFNFDSILIEIIQGRYGNASRYGDDARVGKAPRYGYYASIYMRMLPIMEIMQG